MHTQNEKPYRNKHTYDTQICTLLLGPTALRTYSNSNRAVQIQSEDFFPGRVRVKFAQKLFFSKQMKATKKGCDLNRLDQGMKGLCCSDPGIRREKQKNGGCHSLSGLVAGDSAICGRLAALILRLRPAGLRFEELRSPVKRGGLGLRFSNRSGFRPAAI